MLYLSVHRGGYFYPGTGRAKEVGEDAGEGFTVNVPLPAGAGREEYREAFVGMMIPVLREYEPEVLIVSAGYDSHAADPLGGMRLASEDFGSFAASLNSVCRESGAHPPVFVAEGGYDLPSLTESVAATIEGCNSGDLEIRASEGRGGSGITAEARAALSPYWEALR